MNLFIIEDEPIFRGGLKALFSATPDVRLVGEAGDAREAFSLLRSCNPDLLLVDILLPGMEGICAARELRRRCPGAKIVLFSGHYAARDVLEAFAAGVHGFVVKTASSDELLTALRTVMEGGRYLSPDLLGRVTHGAQLGLEGPSDARRGGSGPRAGSGGPNGGNGHGDRRAQGNGHCRGHGHSRGNGHGSAAHDGSGPHGDETRTRDGVALACDDTDGSPAADVLAPLSAREREIFPLLVRGFSNERIARELCVSAKTIDTHRQHIYGKLECHSGAELVRFAALNGLLREGRAGREALVAFQRADSPG